jgi:hypothetical protein
METFARFKTVAVIPALVWAAAPDGAISDKVSPSVANAEYSDSVTVRAPFSDSLAEGSQTITVKESAKEWTKKMAKRFEELALLEAFGKLSPDQMHELEDLSRDRRNLEYPRSPDEVLWEYKQRRITASLVNAVQEYARLYDFPNNQDQ